MALPRTWRSLTHDLQFFLRTTSSTRQLLPFKSTPPVSSPCITAQRSTPSNFRLFSICSVWLKQAQSHSPLTPLPTSPQQYSFQEISDLIKSPDPKRIIVDVRETSELQSTGRIPTSRNAPLNSSPDFVFLPAEEFEDRFGFTRPGSETEVIFYCKSGVRSKAAARLAQQAGFGGVVSEYPGSWKDWDANGGEKQMN